MIFPFPRPITLNAYCLLRPGVMTEDVSYAHGGRKQTEHDILNTAWVSVEKTTTCSLGRRAFVFVRTEHVGGGSGMARELNV